MRAFANETRINFLEKEFEKSLDVDNAKRIEELEFKISGIIGKNNLNLLRELIDRTIAQYNTDSEWFYNKGYEDANSLPYLLEAVEAEGLLI